MEKCGKKNYEKRKIWTQEEQDPKKIMEKENLDTGGAGGEKITEKEQIDTVKIYEKIKIWII